MTDDTTTLTGGQILIRIEHRNPTSIRPATYVAQGLLLTLNVTPLPARQ